MRNIVDDETKTKLKRATRRVGTYAFKIIAMLMESDLDNREIKVVCEQIKEHFERETEQLELAIEAVEEEVLKDLKKTAKE